jgi:two-component system response regulator
MKHQHNIIIVDDDADDREMMKDAFLNAKIEQEYIFCENGEKLVEYLHSASGKQLPSLILLDLNMPGKDGRETLKEIKTDKRYAHIPTIIFTTSSSERDRLMAYQLGANCFVSKPDTFDKLTDMTSCLAQLWLS